MKTYYDNLLAGILALATYGVAPAHGQAFIVAGTHTIYGAGLTSAPGGGDLPPVFNFSAGPGQTVSFSSVNGSVTSGPFSFGPDGQGSTIFTTAMDSFSGLSGIQADTSFFLVGVFLDGSSPSENAPLALDFRSVGLGRDFLSLAPEIAQTFYIGDGRIGENGIGAVQNFVVPSTATRLFLGIVDGEFDGSGVGGQPANYSDNGGSFTANLVLVPEPSNTAYFAIAAVVIGLGFCRRRQLS
jgi:hypothetical protein